jgi:hypothetical protein
MIRFAKSLLFAILLTALFVARGQAQTINAASCNSSDVQSALSKVGADGTTVSIPAGTCTWTTGVTYNQVYSTIIQGQSTTTGTCAPGGSCAATDSTNITLSGGFTVTTVAGKSLRLTGISFATTGSVKYGALTLNGASTAVRVDHNHFTENISGEHTIQVDGIRGVFDHNYLQTPLGENINFFQVGNYGAAPGTADTIWTQPENFGSSDFVYIENNYFYGSFIYDCDYGGKIALRYNILWYGTQIQTHGTGSGGRIRGCRATETYENSFTYGAAGTTFFAVVDYEGGPSMWWGNTVSGFDRLLREQEVRASTITYTQNTPPAGWGYCGTTQTGAASNWDRNGNSTGYACLDQVGRGAGDLLQGGFTSDGSGSNNVCDANTTNCAKGIYTGSWPNQALIPTYAWTNTFNPDGDPQYYWQNLNSFDPVVENCDYYLQLPNINESATFNGTAGIGQGSSLPSTAFPTCTTNSSSDAIAAGTTWLGISVSGHWGPGYWDTSNSTLYVCTATNTWTAYYTPYTYPHPLVGSGSTSVSAPTNLTATVN